MSSVAHIIDVSPAPSAIGIPLGDHIQIVFDQEMDLNSINTGSFVLTGPDNAPVFGPIDVTPFDEPGFEDEDILSSPYFQGYVKGTISYLKVDASGGIVAEDTKDLTGAGNLWHTVAIFTPEKPLKPNVEYTCIILGDEAPTDDVDTGVRTRTVFDTSFVGSGTGVIDFHGGYTGENNRTYVIEITTGGAVGDAEYIWWEATDPLTTYSGITSTGARELEDGIYTLCEPDGTFTTGDKFEVVIRPAVLLENNYRWTFMTGSGSIMIPPSTSSASGIDSITDGVTDPSTGSTFYVTDSDPEDGEYGVSISTDPYTGESISITFSNTVDPATIAGTALDVISYAANGRQDLFAVTGDLDFVASLSSAVLTIVLGPAQLYENNIVVVKLRKTIADTDGVTLGSHQELFFTTTYSPLYSDERTIRLDLGPLVADVPRETIMMAILEASITADANAFTVVISNARLYNEARWRYTTCLAELILVKAMLGDVSLTDRMSKTLGDLSVSRGGGAANLRDTLAGLEDCAFRWEIAVQTGGSVAPGTSIRPDYGVKGASAIDAISVGRQWYPTSGIGTSNSMAGGNDRTDEIGRRTLKTFRKRH